MKQRLLGWIGIAGLAFGIMTFAPGTSHATTASINNVSVTVGGVTWCITGCANNIWSTAAGSQIVSPDVGSGNTVLILTQTAASPFNFDTSERGGAAPCTSANPCSTSLTINGVNIPIAGTNANALANFNLETDPVTRSHNEATNWNGAVFNGGTGG